MPADEFSPQRLARLAWAFSRRGMPHVPLSAALAAASRPTMTEFGVLEIEATAWASARWGCAATGPCISAISASSLAKIAEVAAQGLEESAWACSRLRVHNGPLMAAIAAQAIPRIQYSGPASSLANTAWSFSVLK